MRKSVWQSDPARRFGFTLIELLVVVAIIGLLLSILMPSLAAAREQARTTKCIANLKTIGNTMHQYFGDHRDWFPFEKRNWPQNGVPSANAWVLTAFHYGGHPGRMGGSTFQNMHLRDTFRGRPFNPYLYQNLYDVLEQPAEAGTGEFEERRRPFDSGVFACPSDLGPAFNTDQSADNGNYVPTHYTHGTSWDINYHFVWLWAASGNLGAPHTPFGPARALYLERANRFLARQRNHNVSRFVMLYEDIFDSAQYNNIQKVGWHKKLNRYSFLFLDGHAGHITADTSKGNNGPGWKTSSGMWYNNPDDPDYPLRGL